MASISNIISSTEASSTKQLESSIEGSVSQLQSSTSTSSTSSTSSTTSTSTVSTTATKVEGTLTGSSNQYTFKPNNEKQTSLNAQSSDYNKTDGTLSNVDLNSKILPYDNILQKYHNYTWNFSLYTMSDAEYKIFAINSDQEVSKYIIARSGVTGRMSINSVKMTTAGPATPGLTSNYSLNTCVMEICENGSMSFIDDLIVLSNTLGYKKMADVPLVLELDFVGYDQDTGANTIIPGLNRKWGMRINNIQTSASEAAGSMTYTMTMTSTQGGMMQNRDWTMLEQYNCTSATFGDFIQSLQEKLNRMASQQYGYLANKYQEFADGMYYQFILPSDLSSMTINYDSKQSPETGSTPSGGQGSKNFTWAANVPISKAIDDVLDCCTPTGENIDNKRQFVNIIPISRYVGYDPIRKTSAYKNYFYILKYKIGDVVSKDDLVDEKFNLEYFFENANKVPDPSDGNKLKLVAKRYDYQYSGLNNEILSLELKFDQAYQIAITRNPMTQLSSSNSSGTHTAEIIQLGDQQYNTSVDTDVQSMWAKSQQIQNQAKTEGRELTDSERQFVRDASNVTSAKLNTEGETEQTNNNLSISASAPVYIEDFRNDHDLTVEGTNGIGKPRVDGIPMEPMNIETTNAGSKNDSSSDSEMERRLVRDNYYNRSFLQKLDMKVIGDPFWLGWGDYTYMKYLDRAAQGSDLNLDEADRQFANYLTAETYLLLNLKPIAAISDDTGIIEINNTSVFSQTLYRVNKIVSEFNSNGTFTQQITGGIVIRSLRRKDQLTT